MTTGHACQHPRRYLSVVNVNRNVNVDVDRHGWGCCYHPVATEVAVGATAAVIGSVVNTLPPCRRPAPQ
jgi:hypothetical protein